ncbi:hypothetical protein [Fulvivirga sp. M361]|nr:hypothetical protein [Fulvivirga sp. M361]
MNKRNRGMRYAFKKDVKRLTSDGVRNRAMWEHMNCALNKLNA